MVRRVLDRGKEAARVVKSDVATGVTEAAAAVQEGRQRRAVNEDSEESDEPPENETYQEARERILGEGSDDDGDADRRTLRDRLKSLGDKAERLGERAGTRTGRAAKRYSTVRDELSAHASSAQSAAGHIPSAAGVNPTMRSVEVGMQSDYGAGGRRYHNYRKLTNTRTRISYGKRHGDGSQTVVVALRSGEGSWTAQAQEYGPDGRLVTVSEIGQVFLSKRKARRALTAWMSEHPGGVRSGGGTFGGSGFGAPSFGGGQPPTGGRSASEEPGRAFRFTGLNLEGWGLGIANGDADEGSEGGGGLDFSGFGIGFGDDFDWGWK